MFDNINEVVDAYLEPDMVWLYLRFPIRLPWLMLVKTRYSISLHGKKKGQPKAADLMS